MVGLVRAATANLEQLDGRALAPQVQTSTRKLVESPLHGPYKPYASVLEIHYDRKEFSTLCMSWRWKLDLEVTIPSS